jgi:O-acetyl-ADP-ribose deacetylase (regulator of RNase III)
MTGSRFSGDKMITCVVGDITDSTAEAIVNAANNHLWMGSGVAGAIKRRGGDRIEREAMALGPIPVGEAVATSAGNLPQKHVIHAAVMGQDLLTDSGKIEAATRNSLRLAEDIGVKSIAFPALGTGVGGFPIELAAQIMIRVARDFLRDSKSVARVEFILFDNDSFESFKSELDVSREV